MKKPHINQENRQYVYLNTTSGAFTMLDLRFKQLGKSILKDKHLMCFLLMGYPIIYTIIYFMS